MALEAAHADEIVKARTWLVICCILGSLPSTAYCDTTTTEAVNTTEMEATTTTTMTTTTTAEPTTTELMCGEGEKKVGNMCECLDDYYRMNGTCKSCSRDVPNCISCRLSDESDAPTCTLCNDTFYLQRESNECYEKCPKGSMGSMDTANENSTTKICTDVHPCKFGHGELYEVCIAVPIVGAVVIVGVILLAVWLVRKKNARPAETPINRERKQSILPNPFEREAPPEGAHEGMPSITETPDETEMARIENVPHVPKPQPKKSTPGEDQEYYGNMASVGSTRNLNTEVDDDDPQEDYQNVPTNAPVPRGIAPSKSLPNLKNEVPPPPGASHSSKSRPGYVNLPSLSNNCASPDARTHSYVNIKNKDTEKGQFGHISKQHTRPQSVTQGANNNGYNVGDDEQTIYANA